MPYKNPHPLYFVWRNMINRCHSENSPAYKWYGAKGISVCDEWRNSFDNFVADMGERPEGGSIERKDVKGNYCKENCCWASMLEQQRNRSNTKLNHDKAEEIRRDFHDKRMSKQKIADVYGVSRTLVRRIISGELWP